MWPSFILTSIYNNLYIICEGGVLKMGHRITECNPPTSLTIYIYINVYTTMLINTNIY